MMNSNYKIVIGLIAILGINGNVYAQLEKIMSYNIRFDNPDDHINTWDNRKLDITHLVKYYEPDVLGIQEALSQQLIYLDKNLPNYSRIGVGRDDGRENGEFCAIYYNNKKLSLIEEVTFWLSETPDSISIGWDAAIKRVCTYGLFENKITQNKIAIFNTHYDHIGEIAREKSSELLLKKINQLNKNNFPIALLGDFNAEPDSRPIKIITEQFGDTANAVPNGIYGPPGTFTGFDKDAIATRRIDYIFVKDIEVQSYRHIDDRMKNNNCLSDHLPVLVELKIE